jgi:hypothetical protein
MKNISTNELEFLIANNRAIINFGTPDNAVDEEWIAKAETTLQRALPDSYKWFLKRYSGGEVGGEEIYSIYGIPFESVNGGDIVFQYLCNRNAGILDDSKIVLSETDSGEVFFFDYARQVGSECPVSLRLPDGKCEEYACNFYEFLYKRILAHA